MTALLLSGDTHGTLHAIVKLTQEAKKQGCNRIFQVGDFGAWEHMESGKRFMNGVEALMKANDMTMYWLRGNHDKVSHTRETYTEHDDEGFLIVRPHVKYAEDGLRWTWEGVRFMAFGGAYSVDKEWRLQQEQTASWSIAQQNNYRRDAGAPVVDTDMSGHLWFPEEEATDHDVAAILLTDSSPVDILLTHDKPRASNPGWNRKDYLECYPNQDRIMMLAHSITPKFNIHGHLHYLYKDEVRLLDETWMTVVGLDAADVGKFAKAHMTIHLDQLSEIFSALEVS